jgi:hypothetical protein
MLRPDQAAVLIDTQGKQIHPRYSSLNLII